MKHILLFIAIFVTLTIIKAEDFYIVCDRTVSKSQRQFLQLKIKLDQKIFEKTLPSYCGDRAECQTYKYKIVDVIKGDYKDSTILVNILCPREYFDKVGYNSTSTFTYTVSKLPQLFILDKNFRQIPKDSINIYEIIE